MIKDERTREQLSKVSYDNIRHRDDAELVDQIYSKRHRLATLIGFSSYSEMVLESRMARDPQTV
jgi:Zn-dependent oligopeptidase